MWFNILLFLIIAVTLLFFVSFILYLYYKYEPYFDITQDIDGHTIIVIWYNIDSSNNRGYKILLKLN